MAETWPHQEAGVINTKNTIDIVLKILRIKTVQGVLGDGAQPPVLDIWGHRFLEERRLA